MLDLFPTHQGAVIADLIVLQVANLGMCRQSSGHDHVTRHIDWNEDFALLSLVDDDDRSVRLGELLRRQRPRIFHEGFYGLFAELISAGSRHTPQKHQRGHACHHYPRRPRVHPHLPLNLFRFSVCSECFQNTSVAVDRTAALHIASMPIRLASLSPKLVQIKAPHPRAFAPRLCPVRAWQLCHEVCEPLVLSR